MESFPQTGILSANPIANVQSGYAFTSHTGEMTSAGITEAPALLVLNPDGSKISVVSFSRKLTAITKNKNIIFRYYFNPVVTANGTLTDTNNLFVNDGSEGIPIAKAKVYLNPTVSSKGIHITTTVVQNATQTTDVPLIIDDGAAFLVTVQTESIGDQFNFDFLHYEARE